MGIRPNGQGLPQVAYDTPQDQFGGLVSELESTGATAGEGVADIAATAESANETAQQVALTQAQMNGRLDLLDGVRGYCAAYQSLNITTGKMEATDPLGWFPKFYPEERILPFDAQIGPAKGAKVGADGIEFEASGLWTVHVLCRRENPNDKNPSSTVTLRCVAPNGDLFAESEYVLQRYLVDSSADANVRPYPEAVSVSMTVPIVIPAPGYKIAVFVKDSTSSQWWTGGTKYSSLAVVKHDNRVENTGAGTVPNEQI